MESDIVQGLTGPKGAGSDSERRVAPEAQVYCLVSGELSYRAFSRVEQQLAAGPGFVVLRERRSGERRSGSERRREPDPRPPAGGERRKIKLVAGRRAGEQRAHVREIEAPELPRRLRGHAEGLRFVEPVPRPAQELEDADTTRAVTRVQAGELEAFGEIYFRYVDRIDAYMRLVVRDDHEAEELTQHLFVEMLSRMGDYEGRGAFRAWLFAAARNQAAAHLKARRRTEPQSPEEIDRRCDASTPGDADLNALRWVSDQDLLFLLQRLPLAQRQVIFLRFMAGLGAGEIAEVLGRSDQSVRSLQHRAMAFLRERLTALGREPLHQRRAKTNRPPRRGQVSRARRYALLWSGPVR